MTIGDSDESEEIGESDLSFDSDPEPPGNCPVFTFLPSKVQLIQMILKAAYIESDKNTLIRT